MTNDITRHDTSSPLYNIVYADPPWEYDDKALAGNRGAGCKYTLMNIEDIKNIKVDEMTDKDAILFLWVTYPKLQEGLDVIKAWGFEYKTVAFTWIKTNSNGTFFMGMGGWTRANAEICLLATKGSPKRLDAGISQIIKTVYNGNHSQKPDIIRQKIIQLIGDLPRIELFARTKVHGWDVWGNDSALQNKPLEVFSSWH